MTQAHKKKTTSAQSQSFAVQSRHEGLRAGRPLFLFNDDEKNERLRNKQAREAEASASDTATDAADDDTQA